MRPGALLAPQGAHAPHQDLGLRRVESATEPTRTVPAVLGEWLEALALRVKLHRTEWRVIAIVLSSPYPVSASSIAKRLGLDYGLVKRIVRELAR
jgi:DNA-binding MarR family transcriptional regulator